GGSARVRRPRARGMRLVPQGAAGREWRGLGSLLRRLEGPRRNPRGLELGERLRRRALGSPLAHALRDGFTVIPAREVVLEPWVGEPVVLAHQLGPAPEQRLARGHRGGPAGPCGEAG